MLLYNTMRFRIKNCLTSMRNLVKSMACCNSSCCRQTINMLDDETINKIDQLQTQVENMIGELSSLRESFKIKINSDEEEKEEKEIVNI